MSDNAGTASAYERQNNKSNSSSNKSSPSLGSKDVYRSQGSSASENQNGFTKPKDYHSSSSSSPSKHRGHLSSSKENERVHASSSSTPKDFHSSSKSREHSASSSRPESGLKHKDGSGGSSTEGSSSKPKEGVFSGLNKVERSSRNRDGGHSGDKVRGTDGLKSHSSSSQFSSSSHKEKHQSGGGSRVDSDKVSSKGDCKPEKQHQHRSDARLPTDATKLGGMSSSPVKVKSEARSPSKSQDARALIKSDEDEASVVSSLFGCGYFIYSAG